MGECAVQSIVGEIREINRYPVKSFGGESLDVCDIESYGLKGDRFCSFYDETKEGWWRYITARSIPNMMKYQAKFKDESVQVVGPDGTIYGWDEELLKEIQKMTDTRITMSKPKNPHPEHPHLLSVDGASILILTDATLRKLEALWGKPVDQRRFRGNFVVAVNDDSIFEGDWIGQQLSIGEVQLQVDSYCERCVMITMDPDNQAKDPSLHKKVHQAFENRFGVYASVIKPGKIRLGDQVTLVGSEDSICG